MPDLPRRPEFAALPVTLRAGGPLHSIDSRPLPAYAPEVLEGLGALSRRLLDDPQIRQYPDVATFAYWCRSANLRHLAEAFHDGRQRLGRGLALHITPANVPINFAYSLAFGMLAGNANIVRVPEAFPQTAIVCEALAALFAEPRHARIAAMNRLVSYPRNDDITRALSAHCQARLLWGGDEMIAHLRTLPIPPRCIELTFSDRYSLCLLAAAAVRDASPAALEQLAAGFYNDAYLLDQNACSSPHLVFWLGTADEAAAAQARFWPSLTRIAGQKYPLTAIQAVDKLTALCRFAATLPDMAEAVRHANLVYRIRLDTLPADIAQHRGRHGLFFEYVSEQLDSLAPVVNARYQTLSTFGLDRDALVRHIAAQGLAGIDRVVPVGKALDIGVLWDGHDLAATLSRIVASQ